MRGADPIVSVIMGVYNIASSEEFSKAIDSILHQTFQGFELIICDDGSSDGTWQRLQSLLRQDPRVKLLQNRRNQGLANSLNRCVEQARGAFIARQDADDLSCPERLGKQVDFLKTHQELGFVGSNTDLFDSNGIWRERHFPVCPEPEDFLFTLPFIHGSLMFRREVLVNNLYKIAKETRRTEDYELLMRLYANGIRGGNVQEPLYLFREDKAAQRRRKFRYRLDEAVVKWKGFRTLGLMPKALPYVVKPLIVGLIPADVLRKLKLKRSF